MKKRFIFLTLALSIGGTNVAKAASVMNTGIGAQAGAYWGLGTMHDATGSINSRVMDTASFDGLVGYRFAGLLIGALGEYQLVGQLTDPVKVSNTNMRGNGWLAGAGLGYSLLFLDLSGGVFFLGKHSNTNADVYGNFVSFGNPLGLEFTAGFRILPGFSVDAKVSITRYGKLTGGTTDYDISENRLMVRDAALGVSFHY